LVAAVSPIGASLATPAANAATVEHMDRPVIGLCAALEQARWGVWDQPAFLLPRNYVDAVQRAGGLAVLLVPDQALERDPEAALDLIDGLILAGGADIDPSFYGDEPHPETLGTVPERDRFEIAMVRGAIERDLPLLGICRGMQLLNIALGGTLHQHLPDVLQHSDHRRALGTFEGADHDVSLEHGSLVAEVAGEHLHATKSHHHQGVDQVGEGLVITGRSSMDDVPEAIELPGHRFVLGVQWHPEADEASEMVSGLVRAASSARAEQMADSTT
jgi:putative glutamine amidotransferase